MRCRATEERQGTAMTFAQTTTMIASIDASNRIIAPRPILGRRTRASAGRAVTARLA